MSEADVGITLLFDGQCALCAREAAFLARRDAKHNPGDPQIALVDIADPTFDASAYGLTQDDVMGAMHGVLPDGEIVVGMEVFRRAYSAIGLGWLLAPTGWPGLRWLFDQFYRWFARHRMKISKAAGSCVGGVCRVPTSPPRRATDAGESLTRRA